MDIPLGWQLFIQVILIAVNAVFASAEIAIVSMNELKLEKLAEDGNRRAKRLRKLTEKPAGFLATIQIAITLSGFLGSAFAADNFSDVIVRWLVDDLGVQIKESTLNTIAVIVITIILSYVTLVFGELVPKRQLATTTFKLAVAASPYGSQFDRILNHEYNAGITVRPIITHSAITFVFMWRRSARIILNIFFITVPHLKML